MSTDDKTVAQDAAAAAAVGSDPAPDANASASSAPAITTSCPGHGSDNATPDTAAVASVPVAAGSASPDAIYSRPARSTSPSSKKLSILAEPATSSTTSVATTDATALTTTTTTTAAAATATTSAITVPDDLAAVAVSTQPAAQTPPSSVESPVAVASTASQSQQNGDSKAPEPESDMASYRPALTSHYGAPVSFSTSTTTMPSSSHLTAASPPAASAYSSHASISTTQYSAYPSSTMASHATEGYRISPVPSSNPMSLPSMRTIDSIAQQRASQTQHTMSMSMNAPLTSTPNGSPFYSSHHTMSVPSTYGLPSDSMPRYPLPHDPRILGSRGPKKEIKRRTKTGCLTCRKRRIKCDETHPTCNNCKKSKRECLGYDPIFRQQPGTQPNSHIQPAPISQPAVSLSVSSVSAHLTAGIGHTPAPANSYGSQPSMLPSSYSTTPSPSTLPSSTAHAPLSGYNSPAPARGTTPVKQEAAFDFAAPIDTANRQLPPLAGPETKPYDSKTSIAVDRSHRAGAQIMKINEIIDLLGPPPPRQPINHTEETYNEITKVYHEMYAGGLSAFLETTWFYFIENGKMAFPRDPNLVEHMATFLKILEAVRANDHSQMAYSGVLETRIVWELACTAYQTPDRTNQSMRTSMPVEGDAIEARNRLRVVEALLCGEYLTTNPLAPPLQDPEPHRTRQFDFWYSLAEFVRKRDLPDAPQVVQAREDALSRMRHLLDGRENRDVLYSIAVVRELAPHYGPSYGSTPQYADETDPKNRLAVASRFILDEAQVTGGTTNVVRRFSDIASRAFVNPGVNVARRPA